jgi:solute carrier family 25 iron transporter 28/37
MYRGLSAVLIGAIPSHAVYFATYEVSKKFLHNRIHKKVDTPPNLLVTGVSAILATAVHDAISTPLDVVKQRMQVCNSKYKKLSRCIFGIAHREGVRAFYISYPTTLLMNIPYSAFYFMTYETVKYLLRDKTERGEEIHEPWKHVTAGGIAGAIGAAVSNPFDVIKTHLQTQGHFGIKYNGLLDTASRIYKIYGWKGFTKGITARVVYCAPSAAITCTYPL